MSTETSPRAGSAGQGVTPLSDSPALAGVSSVQGPMARLSLWKRLVSSSRVARSTLGGLVLAALLGPVACTVRLDKGDSASLASNQCSQSADCGSGTCWSGTCVAYEGALSTLLLEITPPTTVQNVGGVRFLQIDKTLARSSEDHNLNLDRVSTVRGFVFGYDAKSKGCSSPDTPLEVTLTPQEQAYGLAAVSYVVRTQATAVGSECESQLQPVPTGSVRGFVVDVPAGKYDVYVRPVPDGAGADAGATSSCELVPELFSGIAPQAGDFCLALPARPSQQVAVDIRWPASAPPLEGWTVDIVHPLGGQLLSERRVLHGPPTELGSDTGYTATIRYSRIGADDAAKPGQELLRLTPPSKEAGPVVQFGLSGLVAPSAPSAGGTPHAVLPTFGPFLGAVQLDSWVWRADEFARNVEVPVPASVTFTATQLEGIPSGVFASFSTTADVGKDGRLHAVLLPGEYRVRVLPDVGLGLAATELPSVSVSCVHNPASPDLCAVADPAVAPTPQAGRLLLLPPAASIRGTVHAPVQGDLSRAVVSALPATIGVRHCPKGADAAACATEPLGVLDVALAEDAFVPRPVSGVLDARGAFTLSEVDCGGCTASDGAIFDISVRPPEGTGLPWLTRAGVSVWDHVDLGSLELTLPVVHRGKVQVPIERAPTVSVPGALIRAYVIRDAHGAPILAPEGLPSCAAGQATAGSEPPRCIRSVLQVAQTRAKDDGTYELVLPSQLE
jgi:hypothetical protein